MKQVWVKLKGTCASPEGVYYEGDFLLLPENEAKNRVDSRTATYDEPTKDIFPAGEFRGRNIGYVLRTFGKNKLVEAVEWIRENSPDTKFLALADSFINDIENSDKCRCPECGSYHKIKGK